MKRVLQFIAACVPMALVMILIYHFSSQEASVSSATSRSFIADLFSVFPSFRAMSTYHKLQVIGQAQFFVRKAAHFSIYALLGVLAMLPSYVVFQKWGRSAIAAWCVTLLFSASDEFHQTFVPGRSGEIRDVLIDAAGAALGILVIYGIIRLWQRRGKKYDTQT